MADWRPLTDWERAVLLALVSEPFPGRDALRLQVDGARARPWAEPGGPQEFSVFLSTDPAAPDAAVKAQVATEGEAVDEDGVPIHCLLHVKHGRMATLEVYKADPSPIVRLPGPEELTLFHPVE